MAELTPKERVMRLLRKEPIDTMPFFSGMGMVVMPGIKKAGVNFPSVHTDPERMARSGGTTGRGHDSPLRTRRCRIAPGHGAARLRTNRLFIATPGRRSLIGEMQRPRMQPNPAHPGRSFLPRRPALARIGGSR